MPKYYRLNPHIRTYIPTHYRKENGELSCGVLIGVSTRNKNEVDCPICLKNLKEK